MRIIRALEKLLLFFMVIILLLFQVGFSEVAFSTQDAHWEIPLVSTIMKGEVRGKVSRS